MSERRSIILEEGSLNKNHLSLMKIPMYMILRILRKKKEKCERRDLNPWIPSKPDLKSGPFGQALVPSRLITLEDQILEPIP